MMKNKTLLIFFIFILHLSFFLYVSDPEDDQNKVAKTFEKAYHYIINEDWQKAIKDFQKIIKEYSLKRL